MRRLMLLDWGGGGEPVKGSRNAGERRRRGGYYGGGGSGTRGEFGRGKFLLFSGEKGPYFF